MDFSDPLMSAALADQIMIDPDMVNRNGANRVASFASLDGSVPRPDGGADAIRAAREEALDLVGGTNNLLRAPQPESRDGSLPAQGAFSVVARAATSASGMENCAAIANFSAIWAARMPVAFPVYPRGAVQEAAGTDDGACHLRAVNFVTPVPLAEVMDFYYTRARAENFDLRRTVQGEDDVLAGTRGTQSVTVFARELPGAMVSVDLVTSGN